MLWLRTWKLGIKSLLLHPMRSLLTVLGIFIGVASVIWLLAIGEGISREAQRQIEGLGATNIIVRSIKPPSESSGTQRGPVVYGLTREDYRRLEETIPTLTGALPVREIRRRIMYGTAPTVDGRLVGCTTEYFDVTRLELERGRLLSPADIKDAQNYCVLAASVAERLFVFEDPIGRRVYLPESLDYYEVVGVLRPRNPSAAIGGSLDSQDFSNDLYVPITTVKKRVGDTTFVVRSGSFEGETVELNQITLQVDHVDNVLKTADLVKATLRNHDAANDVAIVTPLELLEQARTTRFMFMMFMGLIAAISLLVGGIGIMNIMLATVTERTREIGIRRALGARRKDITRQFLVETVALSVVGGITGILGGVICPAVINFAREIAQQLRPDLIEQMPDVVRTVVPVIVRESIPLAFLISVAVGVIFGIYPAMRAAALDPIEALRHE